MSRSILICCPTHDGKPGYLTAMTMQRMIVECAERGWHSETAYRVHDSLITRARDVAFSMFIHSDHTDLFFIDSDISCEPGDFPRLMDHPVELVGGSYLGRKVEEEWVLKPLESLVLQFDQSIKTGVMEVDAIPTGFMRITRSCAEKMLRAREDEWYIDPTMPGNCEKLWLMFECRYYKEHRHVRTEDYEFCKKWRDLGGKVYVDPFLTLTHCGSQNFKGNLLEYLKRKNAERDQIQSQQKATVLDLAKAQLAEAAA